MNHLQIAKIIKCFLFTIKKNFTYDLWGNLYLNKLKWKYHKFHEWAI